MLAKNLLITTCDSHGRKYEKNVITLKIKHGKIPFVIINKAFRANFKSILMQEQGTGSKGFLDHWLNLLLA